MLGGRLEWDKGSKNADEAFIQFIRGKSVVCSIAKKRMGGDKGGPKSRGFFHLFDWNKKSRKKLFSVSPESTKQEKRIDDSLPGTKLGLLDEEKTIGISSMKGCSDYSCASSVTDEEGNGIRALGVVARLMGLNSMPASGFPEPYSTPLPVKISLGDKQSHKRSPEFFINDQFNHARNRAEAYTRKPTEFRIQKMPSSPIERFQTETLPPRSVKVVSLTNHKLLSPIKTPGFISPRNAAHIMEEAAKIIEPVLPVNSRAKASFPYGPLKIHELKNSIAASQRTSGALELARIPVVSADIRCLKGQSLNRSWNDLEDSSSTFRPSPDISDTNSLDGKGKGKSLSLAIQAKVNVQRRKGLSINSRNASLVLQDVDEGKLNQPFKSQTSNQKNKQQKKILASGETCVLIQNNQKQNCLSVTGKVTRKQSVSNQQGRKDLCRDNSAGKKTTTKRSGNSRVANREDSCTIEFDGFLSNKDFPQKKRLIEGDFNSQRISSIDNIQVMCQPKHVHSNVVIDEQSRWSEENLNNGADVVSFTFKTPLVKSTPGLLSSTSVEENCENRNTYKFDSNFQRNSITTTKLAPQGLNLTTGDALSLLLEHKLRELTSGDESSYCDFADATSSTTCAPIQRVQVFDTDLASTSTTGHKKKFVTKTCGDQQSLALAAGMSSTNGHVFGLSYKLQGLEGECSSSSDARNGPNVLQRSPLSVLETSFSSESCKSSVSTANTKGSKISLYSTQAHNIINSNTQKNLSSFEIGLDLSDSACSSSSSGGISFPSKIQQNHANSNKQDLDYMREILNSRKASAIDLTLSPLNLLHFNKLEKKRGNDSGRTRRKMMFDCVNECLDSRCSRFFRLGYQGWANGEAMRPKDMAKEIYEEISRWKGFGDCMVDELVNRDMSTHRGRWVDFEMEAFELGEEIEKEFISYFIDEVVTDCFYV